MWWRILADPETGRTGNNGPRKLPAKGPIWGYKAIVSSPGKTFQSAEAIAMTKVHRSRFRLPFQRLDG